MDFEEHARLWRKKPRKLVDIDVDEITLCGSAATRKKFFITKMEESMKDFSDAMSLVESFSQRSSPMVVPKVDAKKLKEALEQFGSLQNAVENLQRENRLLEGHISQLRKNNTKLIENRDALSGEVEGLTKCINESKAELQDLAENIEKYGTQYMLFCGFMAMLAGSPSVTDSIDTLIALFQRLKEPGWRLPKNPDELRSIFIRKVMGDYLKSFRCEACGAKFITNKEPEDRLIGSSYCCPVCHYWYAVKDDDSLLKVMVSDGKQLEDIQHMEEVLKENEVLKPFKQFLKAPCEICHEPIEAWDDYNTKLVIEGIGFGHTSCWKSEVGQLRQLA
ncbi:hypothetical protein KA005_57290, partial [bacterium]|nr:hypothetical protein [bacterium]